MPITGIAHVNITVPPGTLDQASAFYAGTLGFTQIPVPVLQKDTLAWFDITPNGQQIHVSSAANEGTTSNDPKASRHACFKLDSQDGLNALQQKVYQHFESGGVGKPMAADQPGQSSGAKGVEYPVRFFARDYAGNRLEFSL